MQYISIYIYIYNYIRIYTVDIYKTNIVGFLETGRYPTIGNMMSNGGHQLEYKVPNLETKPSRSEVNHFISYVICVCYQKESRVMGWL